MFNLIWKEWHEQSWKLAFGCLTLAALACIGLHSRLIADESMIGWVCFIGVTMLPVLSSAGLIPAERSEGSFETLLALPVPPRRLLLAKTVIGVLLCMGPMAVAAGVSLLVAGQREMTCGEMLDIYFRSCLSIISLFFWMLALTVRLPTESRAGLLGLGILVFWAIATGGLSASPLPTLACAISPMGVLMPAHIDFDPVPAWMELAVQACIICLLWLWTSRQFPRPVEA